MNTHQSDSILIPFYIQFPRGLAGLLPETAQPYLWWFWEEFKSRCKVIIIITVWAVCVIKPGHTTHQHLFYVNLACEVCLVRAWNSSTLYTSAPINVSQQAALHNLISLARLPQQIIILPPYFGVRQIFEGNVPTI